MAYEKPVESPIARPRTSSLSHKKRKLSYEHRILLTALSIGLPPFVVVELFLWLGAHSAQTRLTLTFLLACAWIATSYFLQGLVVRPLQTLSNMVSALREEDFSFRARGATRDDALGDLITEVNALSGSLKTQRLGALEAVALLKKVLMEIDVAVFTFDPQQRLRIVNRAGEQLMALTSEKMLGRTARELHLEDLLEANEPQTLQLHFPGKSGRWAIQSTAFRENGVPHQLLLISDLSRALREEERQAWQKLIRVLGHELNNSLTPIKSIAGTLSHLIAREELPQDWKADTQRGLEVIENRADALSRFMEVYTKLARLPAPTLVTVSVSELLLRVASLETRVQVAVKPGPEITLEADPVQLEQLLINVIRNAVDASLDPSLKQPGSVEMTWATHAKHFDLYIRDEGPGLLNSTNLFVPFFTTKTGGSGIGLVLSRQIAEAHGGTLTLSNRIDRQGCEALLRLPMR